MLQKTEMVRRGFVNLRTSCYRSSGGPVLLKKCHGRADFRTGPKVHATLLGMQEWHFHLARDQAKIDEGKKVVYSHQDQ